MANYNAEFRSNYFRVKDRAVFWAWCDKRDLQIIVSGDLVGFVNRGNENGLPCFDLSDTQTDVTEIDFLGELAEHLLPSEVAIVMEVGREKMRYLKGYAFAINSEGDVLTVDLDSIYNRVEEEWACSPTAALH